MNHCPPALLKCRAGLRRARVGMQLLVSRQMVVTVAVLVLLSLAIAAAAEAAAEDVTVAGDVAPPPPPPPAPRKKKGRVKKALMVVWAVLFVGMIVGAVYATYRVSSKKGTRNKEEERKKKKEEKKKAMSKPTPPPPPKEPVVPRRVKRQVIESKAAQAAANKFEYALYDRVAEDDSRDRAGDAALEYEFERKAASLCPAVEKELVSARGSAWRRGNIEVASERCFSVTIEISRLASLTATATAHRKYPAEPATFALSVAASAGMAGDAGAEDTAIVTPKSLSLLAGVVNARCQRDVGKGSIASTLDWISENAWSKIFELEAEDFTAKQHAALEAAVKKLPPKEGDDAAKRWDEVAKHVGDGKSGRVCAARWRMIEERERREKERQEYLQALEDEEDDDGGGWGTGGRDGLDDAAGMMGWDEVAEDSEEEEEEEEEEESSEEEDEDAPAGDGNIYMGGGDGGLQHRGWQVKVDQMLMGNVSVAQIYTIRCVVTCERCSTDAGACVGRDERKCIKCVKCKREMSIDFRPGVLHENSSVGGYLDMEMCTPRDVTGLDFWAACGGCGGEAKLKGVGRGSRAECTCRGCFTGMHFGFGGLRVAAVGNAGSSGGGGKGGGDGGKKGGGKEQALNLVVGTPLPDKGACKHFKRSRRWLRFPCCGRVFACPVCHELETMGDHEPAWANKMICGACSREQPFSNKACECGAIPCGASGGATWQGGQGVRDRSKLEKKDSRHTSAKWSEHKTKSAKSERVGQAGKVKREKKALARAPVST